MFGADETEVLVVGAGPVGLLTAVLLAEAGIQVTIIDEEWRTAAHSYACALHPYTLALLDRIGLADAILQSGYRIEVLGFYEGKSRCLAVNLAGLSVDFPFVLVIRQRALEDLLEQRLKQKGGAKLLWNHRLSDLRIEKESVVATVDKLGGTVTGYSVPTWEVVVQKRYETRASFVVGADGHHSLTRRLLGIGYGHFGTPEVYAVFEFTSNAQLGNESRIVLDPTTTSALWPLSGGQCRWSFQIQPEAVPPLEFPSKQRRPIRFCEETSDTALREEAQRLLAVRAPWFEGSIGEFDWTLRVQFGHYLAERFGQGRCWLAGDAAHQTSPVGMQSMNAGLREAETLAGNLRSILREHADLELLGTYGQGRQQEWQWLLGLKGAPEPNNQAGVWTTEHRARIPSCLPATGEELLTLLRQIGLERSAG